MRRIALGHGLHMAVTETGHAASRAIDDLYRRHGSEVYRYALAVLGNRADAEDITQTTFLNAYRALEQGVRPRKPANWLLTIASNAIKQRFRQDSARPRQVVLDERIAERGTESAEGPTVGEILTALSHIPPQQRQAIVLREFEGRSYNEIAEILGVTTSALETLLFRARKSLAEELEHQLTCTEAQFAVSQAADGRLRRKERKRLRLHIAECADCARFAHAQRRQRGAMRGGLVLVPIPVSLTLFKGLEGSAGAATLPTVGAGAAAAAGVGGATGTGAVGGGLLAGGVALKAAAVVTAAGVAGGVGVVGATENEPKSKKKVPALVQKGARVGQTAPRGVLVPGNGVARGKANAPGQSRKDNAAGTRGTSSAGAPSARATRETPSRGQSVRENAQGKPVGSQGRNRQRVTPAVGRGVDRVPKAPRDRVVTTKEPSIRKGRP